MDEVEHIFHTRYNELGYSEYYFNDIRYNEHFLSYSRFITICIPSEYNLDVYLNRSIEMPRIAISNDQRAALRRWYNAQHPKPQHAAAIEWFFNHYQHRLSQSTISESLSVHWSHLDGPETVVKPTSKRQRKAKWPYLEQILADWQHYTVGQGGKASSEILLEKAKEIWPQIPQYSDKPCPDFSYGWLDNFKRRHKIKHSQTHEAAQLIQQETEEAISFIRTAFEDYSLENTYVMDETALLWRYAIFKRLAEHEVENSKCKVSVVFCTNGTGTDRLPLLFIGHERQPHALKRINVQALGGWWRNSSKAWMNTAIMAEWLGRFYSHVGDKRVVLLMDNFSPHQSAVKLASPPSNITVKCLPGNSAGVVLPLNQGIIQNAKQHYKMQFLRFYLQMYDQEQDPICNMSLYHVIKWLCYAWSYEVDSSTIEACFKHSTAIDCPIEAIAVGLRDLTILYHQTIQAGGNEDAMDLDDFLNPMEENQEMQEDIVLEQLVNDYVNVGQCDEEASMEDEAPAPPVITTKQALQSIQDVILFFEQQEDTRSKDLQILNGMEALIKTKVTNRKLHGSLER